MAKLVRDGTDDGEVLMRLKHDDLRGLAPVMESDYKDYGGTVERWADDDKSYPDCSSGCVWFVKLTGALGSDWGVCAKRGWHRAGLLTFEHQAGYGCFESKR